MRLFVSLLVAALTVSCSSAGSTTPRGDQTPEDRTRVEEAVGPQGELGEYVADQDLSFRVFRVDCGTGELGDQDSMIRAPETWCGVGFEVLNHGDQPVALGPWTHYLRTDANVHKPWAMGMREIVLDDSGTLFDQTIPPGGGGKAGVLFAIPAAEVPQSVELHQYTESRGATVRLPDCRSGCYSRSSETSSASPGIAYGHAVALTQLRYICFEGREWEPTAEAWKDSPTAKMSGQGVIVLLGSERALFRDNTGFELRLQLTSQNQEDPDVCG
jgi:hypothetical protein